MSTAGRLVVAAAGLLDAGGEGAVTLRAVGSAIGVSHNAPYKHFATRDDLLAAVAAADFGALAQEWAQVRASGRDPMQRVFDALHVVVRFGREHPARYRLLFNSPSIAARGGDLTAAADAALAGFAAVVGDAQHAGVLPAASSTDLAVVLFAAAHGLIDADASGRLLPKTGWADVDTGLRLLVGLLAVDS